VKFYLNTFKRPHYFRDVSFLNLSLTRNLRYCFRIKSFISNHNGNVVVLYPSEKILLYSVGYDDDVAFVKIPFLPKPWNDKCYWVEVKDLDNEWYKFEGTK